MGHILDPCTSWLPLRFCFLNLILAQPWLKKHLVLGTFINRLPCGSLHALAHFVLQSFSASVQSDT